MDYGMFAAIAAILAPVFTCLINNRHQYKMRKLEIIQEQKSKVIHEYAEACSNYMTDSHKNAQVEYYKSYGKIYLYANKKHWRAIESIHTDIENGNFKLASEKLTNVCQALSFDIKI